MRAGGVALDGDRRFAFSAIRLKLAFSKISYCTFNMIYMVIDTCLVNISYYCEC